MPLLYKQNLTIMVIHTELAPAVWELLDGYKLRGPEEATAAD